MKGRLNINQTIAEQIPSNIQLHCFGMTITILLPPLPSVTDANHLL
jgi:hypothetical protein